MFCLLLDKSSVVSCTQNYMRIDFDRAFYDTSLFSSITLRDTSCIASINSYNIILCSVPGACGSARSETSSYTVYENEVIFKPKSIAATITRDPYQRVKFTTNLTICSKFTTNKAIVTNLDTVVRGSEGDIDFRTRSNIPV